jgi:L,D-transpeptidase catalytic domain
VAASHPTCGRAVAALAALLLAGTARAESAESIASIASLSSSEAAEASNAPEPAPEPVLAPLAPDAPVTPAASVAPATWCPETGDVVTVITRKRELWLCRDGAVAARFEVALGQGGLDKRKKGDRRTPLGTYALGTPRPSGKFGLFIPIVYPTPEQAAQGQTGGDVGIHGPPRKLPEPAYPSTAYDWTLGCVATGTDSEIQAIADFVRERQPLLVIR